MSGVKWDGGVGGCGDECLLNGGMGKDFHPNYLQMFFWKTVTEGAVTTEAGGLFQCFTILTKNRGGPHPGKPCRGALLGLVEREEGKTCSGQHP